MSTDFLLRTGVLVRHNLLLRLRDPGHLISYLIMPMVLMLVFKPVYGATSAGGPTQVIVGMLVMFSVLSLTVVGNAMLTERLWGTFDRLRSTALSVGELLLGKTLPVFGLLIAQQSLLLVFGSTVVGMDIRGSVPLLGFAVAVWAVTVLAIGSALAMVVRSTGEMNAVSDVGALALSALGGAFAPPALMPGWARALAPVSPGYWAMSALKAAVEADTVQVLRSALVLGCIAVAAGAFAVARARRGLSRIRG